MSHPRPSLLPEPQPSTSKCPVPPQPCLPVLPQPKNSDEPEVPQVPTVQPKVVHSNANASAIIVQNTCNSFTEYEGALDDVSDGELLNVGISDLIPNFDLLPKNVSLPQNTVGAVTSSSIISGMSFCPTLNNCKVTFNFYCANFEKLTMICPFFAS